MNTKPISLFLPPLKRIIRKIDIKINLLSRVGRFTNHPHSLSLRSAQHRGKPSPLTVPKKDSKQTTFLQNGSACYGLSPGLKKCPVAVPYQIIGLALPLDLIDRCHPLTSLHLPPAALGSLPTGHFFTRPTAGPASSSPFRSEGDIKQEDHPYGWSSCFIWV